MRVTFLSGRARRAEADGGIRYPESGRAAIPAGPRATKHDVQPAPGEGSSPSTCGDTLETACLSPGASADIQQAAQEALRLRRLRQLATCPNR